MTPMTPTNPFGETEESTNPFASDMEDEEKASTPQSDQVLFNKLCYL
jgi:hypothetical protein